MRTRLRMFVVTVFLGLVPVATGQATPDTCGAAREQLAQLDQAIQLYSTIHRGTPPPEVGWWRAMSEAGITSSPKTPVDPWGRPIIFERNSDTYELMTLGYDGLRRTDDDQVRGTGWAEPRTCRSPSSSFCRG